MTTQSKVYIEISDIVALRLQCKSCGCSLTLGTESESDAVGNLLGANNQILQTCPACRIAWNGPAMANSPFDSELKELFRQLRNLKTLEPKLGYRISLEINAREED
jgi:hypothetical protein